MGSGLVHKVSHFFVGRGIVTGQIRGTIPPDPDWPYGSRQVRRAAMTRMYFREMSRFQLPRRTRRRMAIRKMHNVYRATTSQMLAEHGHLRMEKPRTWKQKVADAFARLF